MGWQLLFPSISLTRLRAQGTMVAALLPGTNLCPNKLVKEDFHMLDILEIQNRIPHRFPFLMVDRVLELEPGIRAVGLKNLTINEQFFSGHYPQRPIMPGVLMLEAMAQVGDWR